MLPSLLAIDNRHIFIAAKIYGDWFIPMLFTKETVLKGCADILENSHDHTNTL